MGLASSARADPDPSYSDVRSKVHELNVKVDKAVEKYNQARLDLKDSKKRVRVLREQIAQDQGKLQRLRADMGQLASAAYRSSGMNNTVVTFLSSADLQKFLDRAASINEISHNRDAKLEAYRSEVGRLQSQREAARKAVTAQRKIEHELAKRKSEIRDDLSKQQALLDRMDAARAARGVSRSGLTYTGPATGSARAAVEFAYGQLGEPYSWGAAGPGAWDCSGLTMMAWQAGGVSLPHSSAAQYSSGPHVARSNLQAGDLVFFGSPIHHVGIYIGNGQMIHAPHSGTVVQISSIDSDWYAAEYVGAVRP
ncbi:MAG: NlpC/P60 family protein [Streptosporangiaceae bacterium]